MAKNEALINKVNSSFELKCLQILILSYKTSMTLKISKPDWEEKTFSSHLVSLMNKCELALKYKLIVTKEEELEDEDIDNGQRSANEANPIDIRFHQMWKLGRLNYIVEAKNISLSEWRKANGSKVNASQQQLEYVTKGIDRFLEGHFKNVKGCMLGYIVNGSTDSVLLKINNKLESQKRKGEEILESSLTIESHKIYMSLHNNKELAHLFFIYSN